MDAASVKLDGLPDMAEKAEEMIRRQKAERQAGQGRIRQPRGTVRPYRREAGRPQGRQSSAKEDMIRQANEHLKDLKKRHVSAETETEQKR